MLHDPILNKPTVKRHFGDSRENLNIGGILDDIKE